MLQVRQILSQRVCLVGPKFGIVKTLYGHRTYPPNYLDLSKRNLLCFEFLEYGHLDLLDQDGKNGGRWPLMLGSLYARFSQIFLDQNYQSIWDLLSKTVLMILE